MIIIPVNNANLEELKFLHVVMQDCELPDVPEDFFKAAHELMGGSFWFIADEDGVKGFFSLTDVVAGNSAAFTIACLPSFRGRWGRGLVREMFNTCFASHGLLRLWMETDFPLVKSLALRVGFISAYTPSGQSEKFTLSRADYEKKWGTINDKYIPSESTATTSATA